MQEKMILNRSLPVIPEHASPAELSKGISNINGIYTGTSGWNYKYWKGYFYPEELPYKDWFPYFTARFSTVEINYSFYRLPSTQTCRSWYISSPDNFTFAVKGSRFITHNKKLKDPAESIERFFTPISELKEKLGPILWQLPPAWKFNPQRLAAFLEALPRSYKYAFEFRNVTWWNDETYAILNQHDASFCIYELGKEFSPEMVTGSMVYIRLHGPGDNKYQGEYDHDTLTAWADKIVNWRKEGKTVFCYFDNDQNGYAAKDAIKLKNILNNLKG